LCTSYMPHTPLYETTVEARTKKVLLNYLQLILKNYCSKISFYKLKSGTDMITEDHNTHKHIRDLLITLKLFQNYLELWFQKKEL
jgi:hypothetical protein